MKKIFLTYLLFYILSLAKAQKLRLSFFNDSTGLGDDIIVSLVFEHRPDVEVFFPNNGAYFSPFEFVSYNAFPTLTTDTLSKDSTVYSLKLFRIESQQTLQLPVWLMNDGDSLAIYSNLDTLYLKEMIPKENLSNEELESSVNYQFLLEKNGWKLWQLMLLGVFVLLILIGLMLRVQFLRRYRRYRFRKRQREFKDKFRKFMSREADHETLQEANSLWRSHMEWIEDKPYASMSSVEIEKLHDDDKVSQALREIESSLFGGQKSDRINLALHILFTFANERYRERYWQFKKRLKNNG